MYPTETPVPKKSRRLLWIGLAVVVTLIIAAAVVYVVIGNTKQESESTAESPAPAAAATVATNEEVKQNLTALDTTVKQAATDRQTVKSSLEDNKKQIKVGN